MSERYRIRKLHEGRWPGQWHLFVRYSNHHWQLLSVGQSWQFYVQYVTDTFRFKAQAAEEVRMYGRRVEEVSL